MIADPRSIIGHVPGRICVAPTDLSIPYPHGGADIGEIGPTRFAVSRPRTVLRDEVTGFDTVSIVGHGESVAMFSLIRDHNDEGYARFMESTPGATSGFPIFGGDAGGHAGKTYEDNADVFLFSPLDTVNDPAVLMYHAAPLPEETVEIVTMLGDDGDEWGLAIVLEMIRRDSDDKIWRCAMLEDLSL